MNDNQIDPLRWPALSYTPKWLVLCTLALCTQIAVAQNAPVSLPTSQSSVPRWKQPPEPPTYATDVDCWVEQLDKSHAKLDDEVTLTVMNPEAYLQWAIAQDSSKSKTRTIGNLVLFLNDRPLPGMYASIVGSPAYVESNVANGNRFQLPQYRLLFHLVRRKESNDAWARLLDRPEWSREVSVSIGFEDLAPVTTNIRTDTSLNAAMSLQIIPIDPWTIAGAIVLIGSLGIFFGLAANTDLIRDTGAPLKPDGRHPFSLSRSQMAFWFYLVYFTYFVIWVITGDKDTIPGSVLGLIGISAATAVGSSLVDSNRRPSVALATSAQSRIFDGTRRSARVSLLQEIQALNTDKSQFDEQIRKAQAPDEIEQLKREKEVRMRSAHDELAYFNKNAFQVFSYDLLTEDGAISFHRYQMVIWTLVLGIIFLKEVYGKLAMPDFSGTLVGLMGVSSGTFVSLRHPVTKPATP